MFKVRIRSQIVSLCAFREAVRYGAGFCAFNGIEEQPVLLPETERTDRSFGTLYECSHKRLYPQELLIRIF